MAHVADRPDVQTLDNFIGGRWVRAQATDFFDVHNPALGEVIGRTPLSSAADVDAAVQAASRAFPAWRDTPVNTRAQVLYRFKALLEQHFAELARTVTTEHGKTLDEARGSVRRGIECVEVACGAPSLMQGSALEDIAAGIDCHVARQPLGVCAAIAPFNFPAMVPMWFLPFAIVSGNTLVLKPSEQVPLSQRRMVDLLQQCDLPAGVVNLVNGGSAVVNAICDHPDIRAVSFVGSTPVARHVYQRATHAGKRVQALGGAKNFVIVMPDANFDRSIGAISESFYGCAGERCLAGSMLVPVGGAHREARDRLVASARALKVGDGSQPDVTMGPVISARHRDRVVRYIELGVAEGAVLLVDGRTTRVDDRPNGYFVGPTIFDQVSPSMAIGREEIFGPVASICPVNTIDEAMAYIESITNMSSGSCRLFLQYFSPVFALSAITCPIGVATNITPLLMMGGASWPSTMPVEKVHTGVRLFTFEVLI